MRLHSKLPIDRRAPGVLTVEDDAGNIVLGPFPCFGKADSQEAGAHGNPERYPTRPFGDHPYGEYRVVEVERDKQPPHSYGPYFLLLDPIAGDALSAKLNGRTGLALHGGGPSSSGGLRPTEGCLRTTDEAIVKIAERDPAGWLYICDGYR